MYFLSQDQKAVGSGLVWLCRAQDIDEFESYSILLCSKLIQRSTLLYTWFIIVLVKQHMHTFRKKGTKCVTCTCSKSTKEIVCTL